jgi:hypothetical protein
MKLDYWEQKELRDAMAKLIERAAWASRSMCYRSALLEPYAFDDVEKLMSEIEEFKQLWLSMKRKDVTKNISTAFDEVGV